MSLFDRFGKKSPHEISAGGSAVHRYSDAEWATPQVGLPDEKIWHLRKMRDEVYQRRFGEAKSASHELIPLVPHIDVMEYSRSGDNGSVCTLVTSGMSDLAMNVPAKTEAPRRVELILYCRELNQEYIDTMRWLAHFPHDQKTWIGAFHTIPNGNPPAPLWGSNILDTLFLLPPIVKKDKDLQDELILDGDGVHFLWVVPLTTSECNLKLAKGSDAILDMFQKNRHPHVFDPHRKNYV
jgi:Suppressor of fused protein (SUFU)